MFHPPRDRDAHASIRGYIYQIDRTIDRWLSLDNEECLELERGEDIDVVGRLLLKDEDAETESRLLEQIKYREMNVTLRSTCALEALANFHDHRAGNRDADLSFCLLTNAVVGCEQLNPFPNRIPGITLWEQIRTGELDDDETPAAVGQLRQFLLNLSKPDALNEHVWTQWHSYLAKVSDNDFREFIELFEWSTGQPDSEEYPLNICGKVISRGFAVNEFEAAAICDRLFVHVARLLGSTGLKRLTVEARRQLLEHPTLSETDREALIQLRATVAGHSNRLQRLEDDVSSLGSQIEKLYLGPRSAGSIKLMGATPELTLPTPVARLSPRNEVVGDYCGLLATHGWVAIHGGPDMGKSQLVIQIADMHGHCRGWIRFRHSQSTRDAGDLLDAALVAFAGWKHRPDRTEWYSDAVSMMEPKSLVVLDDLPRIAADDPFIEVLSRLGHAAREAGLQIVSTSQFELPLRLRHEFSEEWLIEEAARPFTDDEARELLQAFGAPDSMLSESRVTFINCQASGHPLLLTATAEFLADRNWQFRDDEIEALLRGDHTDRVTPEVISRLTRTVDDSPRELLYRLTLPIGSFELAELIALANVEPVVGRPRERFDELLGAWVQRDTDMRFAVSPLAKPLGHSELLPEIRNRCFCVLADLIVGKGAMNQQEGQKAMLYNLQAREYEKAMSLYVMLLVAALRASADTQVSRQIDMWRSTALPHELSIGNRLLVRGYQLAAFMKFGLDTRFALADVDELLEESTEQDGWGIVALASQTLGMLRLREPSRALKYVTSAIALPRVLGPEGEEIVFDGLSLPDMLWMLVTDLNNADLVHQWLDAVEMLPPPARKAFWESSIGRQGVWLVPNKLYLNEWQKPVDEQNWQEVIDTLNAVEVRVQKLEQPLLEAAITTGIIEILGDRNRVDELSAVAEPILSRWPDEADVQFKVRAAWGRALAYQKRTDDAIPLLDTALHEPHTPHDHERLRCLLAASTCVEGGDFHYIEQARELARDSVDAPAIECARALGEYALACFELQGGQAGAISSFIPWSEAMRQLFNTPNKEKIWRDLFVLFAHATSHLTQLAQDGTSPATTIEGEPSVAPCRGFLLKDYMPERERFYRPGVEAGVFWLMQHYASAAAAPQESVYWMKRAIEESRKSGAVFMQAATSRDVVAELLTNLLWEDAIEAGVFAGRGMVVQREAAQLTRENFDGVGIDLTTEFQRLPEDIRRCGDHFSLIAGVIPAALQVVRLGLTDTTAATDGSSRIASVCRQLSIDGSGDQEMWRTTAELFELVSAEHTNAKQFLDRVQAIEGTGEGNIELRILGCILATWHTSLDDAIHCQLACVEQLLLWFTPVDHVYRLILTPYFESYWQRAIKNCRFAFRMPHITIPAIETAMKVPELNRVRAVLYAASGGFQIRGLEGVVSALRDGP